ncbi:DUF481 domain-containing protein [Reichenbachiella versicolor]|uniref:DUF481 domain-containing protein n=1 Tax=Reichenbachiella versicolor TaxID=1821036 RepID=UPI000D6E27F5|nr:DUF481 domain-containing protein [Reichenbachiella versicolor]
MKKTILVAIFLLTIQFAQGQVLNIEKRRLDQDTIAKLMGNFSFLFNIQEQQGRITMFDIDANLAKLTDKHAYIMIGDMQFINARGESVSSRGFLHGRAVFFRKPRFSPEVFGQVQYDALRGMKERKLIGVGPRCRILSKQQVQLTLGSSMMYEYEIWDFEEQNEKTQKLKNSTYLSWILSFDDRISYNGAVYFQVPFETIQGSRTFTDHYFNFNLTKNIAFLIKFNFWYDDRPVIDVNRTAYRLTTGLKISF